MEKGHAVPVVECKRVSEKAGELLLSRVVNGLQEDAREEKLG